MRITAELSLYPFRDDPIPTIEAFIAALGEPRGVDLVVNQMSTQLCGELDAVVACVNEALRQSFADGGKQVLVAKFLSIELPIDEPPDLSSSDPDR